MCEECFGEIGGGDGGGEHEQCLSCGCEWGVEERTDLRDKGSGSLGCALVHLHALQPDLPQCGIT